MRDLGKKHAHYLIPISNRKIAKSLIMV